MKILIVNDDGYTSDGIIKLAAALHAAGNKVTVVAPERCNSGMSHAMTFRKPVYVKTIDSHPWDTYSVSGTPADCVVLGLEILKEDKPDLVVSGINNEPNLGTDLSYSGTVNAAIEASLHKVRAIALSGYGKGEGEFDHIVDYFMKNFDYYLTLTDPEIAISININNGKMRENRGNRFAHMGERKYADIFTVVKESDGHTYTLGGDPIVSANSEDSDVVQFRQGYATITPLTADRTHYAQLEKWRKSAAGESK